jgi:hypothetical protein
MKGNLRHQQETYDRRLNEEGTESRARVSCAGSAEGRGAHIDFSEMSARKRELLWTGRGLGGLDEYENRYEDRLPCG